MYYTLSAAVLQVLNCGLYHKPNVEFNLATSNCPGLAEFKADLGRVISVYNEWGDGYLIQLGTLGILTSSEGCDDYQPSTPTPQPTNNNSGMMIVIVIIVIIVIIIIIVIFIICQKKNKKHELKKVDKPVENKNDLSAQLPMPYIPNSILVSPPQPISSQPGIPN